MQTASFQPLKSFPIKDPVSTVVFFPDGRRIATGGHPDGTVHIWNLDSGKKEGNPLKGHSKAVTHLAVSSDGTGVVTGGKDSEVLLWTIRGNQNPVSRRLLALSTIGQDGDPVVKFNTSTGIPSLIAFISSSSIDVWELTASMNAARVKQISIPSSTILSACFSQADPNILAMAFADKAIRILNARTGDGAIEFDGFCGSIPTLGWSPTSQRLYSTGSNMKTIHVLSQNNAEWTRQEMVGHTQAIKCVDVHPDGKLVASGGDDKVLRVWNSDTLVEIASSPKISGAITSVAFSPDGTHLITVCGLKKMLIWDAELIATVQDTPPRPSSRTSGTTYPDHPLGQYFSRYPAFNYNPEEVPTTEFYRMCSYFGWRRGSEARDAAYRGFKEALTEQFNYRFGTDVNSLGSWQALCARLGVDPIPDKLEECQRVVMFKHVNLVDLVHGDDNIETFATVDELSDYTSETGKYFAKDEAKAGGLLRHLLRHLDNPELDRHRNSRSGGNKRGRGQRRHRFY